ncbi:MAG: hypothetical protein J6U92_05080, partial [Clostridia bacterium]|nr:hypothetical protein [Clostridia bacterium]
LVSRKYFARQKIFVKKEKPAVCRAVCSSKLLTLGGANLLFYYYFQIILQLLVSRKYFARQKIFVKKEKPAVCRAVCGSKLLTLGGASTWWG